MMLEILSFLQSDLVNEIKCALFCVIIAIVLYDVRVPFEELLFGDKCDDEDYDEDGGDD